MPHIALVSVAAARALDDDLAPLAAALREKAADVAIVDWDDAAVDWSRFDLALLRSPWNYVERAADFLAWAEHVAHMTRLFNPLDVVRWNIDKHYLGELAGAGVAIVPSVFVEPTMDARSALDRFLARDDEAAVGDAGFVIKPCIGAGSRDAQRHARTDVDAALAHLKRLLDAGRSALLQPYLDRVDEHGETALIFFDGKFSHAIRKGPLLRHGDGPTQALFAAEQISARVASDAERALAEQALAAIPVQLSQAMGHVGFPSPAGASERGWRQVPDEGEGSHQRSLAQPLLYARVDLIHDASGAPRLLELELTEPSLFFAHAPGSAQRFAAAVLAHVD